MRLIQLTIFITLLSLIELLLIPVPFATIVLLVWSQFRDEKEALFLAFISGFFYDLVLLRPLGTTSILLTTVIFVATLYKKKFRGDNLFFLALLTFISLAVVGFIYSHSLSLGPLFFYTLLTVIFARIFFKPASSYESWFKLS